MPNRVVGGKDGHLKIVFRAMAGIVAFDLGNFDDLFIVADESLMIRPGPKLRSRQPRPIISL